MLVANGTHLAPSEEPGHEIRPMEYAPKSVLQEMLL